MYRPWPHRPLALKSPPEWYQKFLEDQRAYVAEPGTACAKSTSPLSSTSSPPCSTASPTSSPPTSDSSSPTSSPTSAAVISTPSAPHTSHHACILQQQLNMEQPMIQFQLPPEYMQAPFQFVLSHPLMPMFKPMYGLSHLSLASSDHSMIQQQPVVPPKLQLHQHQQAVRSTSNKVDTERAGSKRVRARKKRAERPWQNCLGSFKIRRVA
eukprot:gnl/Spiro4/25000_TR12422_c0_g1_i1.p1 gnl/Spiro4/25000_TR12422_c0_g1~~gnl/Spiro4/25000_TR12422_c0_g1_i1.p1  ORF type:complete len:210 (-),score=28.05 gnl/Spiro4/25000_TR12422_c0_g1_i1:79-708(-)